MTVKLYKTTSENEVVYKDLGDEEKSLECELMNTDLLNPVLKLDKSALDYNYAFINDFGQRYYFVERPITLSGEHVILQLDVDELMTYKDRGLMDIPTYVKRNEKVGINEVEDTKLPLLPNRWFKSEQMPVSMLQESQNTYILTVVG